MEKISLREIIETKGFSKAFGKMVGYTVKEGKESMLKYLGDSKNGIFTVSYGGCDSMKKDANHPPSISLDNAGIKSSDNDLWEFFGDKYIDFHTHPSKSCEEDLGFSEEDLGLMGCSFEMEELLNQKLVHPLYGVVVVPSDKLLKAKSLFFTPESRQSLSNATKENKRYGPFTKGDALKFLRRYGKADIVDFQYHNRIWQPVQKDEKKLEDYVFTQ